jgi:AraC family transcriptional regulator of adaptative response/methylated-DNA-[protein]-cysteine methyltransferase
MRARPESRQTDRVTANIVDIVLSDRESAEDLNAALSEVPTAPAAFAAQWLTTPLGAMLAIADDKALRMLEFNDRRNLASDIERIFGADIVRIGARSSPVLSQLAEELSLYFSGKLTKFTTPLLPRGTPFQLAAWSALAEIPYGQTRSYQEQAAIIGQPLAHRAVANANARNQIAVVIPCHRIIRHDGSIGGYGGRIDRKRWLLGLEGRNR